MPRGWEGNRRSGVALAMRHGLKWFIHLRAQWPRVGDEHPAYAPAGHGSLYLFLLQRAKLACRCSIKAVHAQRGELTCIPEPEVRCCRQ